MPDPGSDGDALGVVVAGGGVAGLETLVALRALAGSRVRLTLVAPDTEFHLNTLDAGEPFGLARARRYRLADLAARLDAGFVHDAVRGVAGDAHLVLLEDGEDVPFDALVLALGAIPYPALEAGVVFDPVGDPDALRRLRRELETRPGRHVAVVVPAGVSWTLPAYELALMLAGIRRTRVTLVTAEHDPLEAFGSAAADMARAELDHDGVELMTGEAATMTGRSLILGDGRRLDAEHIVHLPRLAGPAIASVPRDAEGFIRSRSPSRASRRRPGAGRSLRPRPSAAHPTRA